MLAGERQRLAVFLAVVKHMPLIAFEHRARHLHRLANAALPAPVQKQADMHAPVLHRVLGVVAHPQVFQMLFQQGG